MWLNGPDTDREVMWDWLADLLRPDVGGVVLPAPSAGPVQNGTSPADWYGATHSWADVLGPHGWTTSRGDGESDGSSWRRPAGTHPCSATIKYGKLFVYSNSTAFQVTSEGAPHAYTKFSAFALLNYDGDESPRLRTRL